MNAQLINPQRLVGARGGGERRSGGWRQRVARLVARFKAARAERRRYWQTVHELEMLSERDLADIGLRRHEIHALAARSTRGAPV